LLFYGLFVLGLSELNAIALVRRLNSQFSRILSALRFCVYHEP
jgi:hypothetical protein